MTEKLKANPSDIVAVCLHQNRLLWSRLQTMRLTQIATLGGSYAIKDNFRLVAILTVVFGAILTILIFRLLCIDRKISIKNESLITGIEFRHKGCFGGAVVGVLIFLLLLFADLIFMFTVLMEK